MKKFTQALKYGSALALAGYGVASHAALDTAVATAITTAQTDVLALLAALTAAGVAIWVGRVIYNHFRVR
jgi:hypothetical protein